MMAKKFKNDLNKYGFLISQLVSRDFKTKYKRSIFGVLWSLLNPLLTTAVQFVVFSTIFNANTENYPIYLITGVICYGFFSTATTDALVSIIYNGNLIKKVYFPKYIFPLSKTISNTISMLISLIPMMLIGAIFGLQIKWSALLIIYYLLCLVIFSYGLGLFLSSVTVYFRDVQFLWTVILQIWSYATPIFYPAEIIPEKYFWLMRINPLYHIIGNIRTCLIAGKVPELPSSLACLGFALISFFIGKTVFKKLERNFALQV